MTATENRHDTQTLQEARISKALGAFLMFFAAVVLVSILFTDTGIGRLTNLGAGVVIGGIGSVMFLKGRKAGRTRA